MRAFVDARLSILQLLPHRSVGAEIGVYEGAFTEIIWRHIAPKKLHLIDPWRHFPDKKHNQAWYGASTDQKQMNARYDLVKKKFAKQISEETIVIHRALSGEAAVDFSNEYFDFVYVDGDHSYEAAKADLFAYFPKLKKGGLLIGDDYSLGAWWKDGVIRAFHDLIHDKDVVIACKIDNQIAVRRLT